METSHNPCDRPKSCKIPCNSHVDLALSSTPNPCVPPCLAVRTRQAIPRHSRSPARAGCLGKVALEASTSWCRASASRSPPAPSTCWSTANSWAPQAPPRSGAAGGTWHHVGYRDAASQCLGCGRARFILSGFHLAVFGAQLGIVGGVRVHLAAVGGCSVVFGVQLCLMGNVRQQLGDLKSVTFCFYCLGCEFAGFGAQLFSVFSIEVTLCRGLGVFGGSFTSDLQLWGPALHCMHWGATLHHI